MSESSSLPSSHPHELSPRKKVYQVLSAVPRGRVTTYGQVAQLAGLGRAARFVGGVLRTLPPGSRLPWHRVVNAQGQISVSGPSGQTQKTRLEEEGVIFIKGRIDLRVYGWQP